MSAADLAESFGRVIEVLAEEIRRRDETIEALTAALRNARVALDLAEDALGAEGSGCALCLSQRPGRPIVFCKLKEGHEGDCKGGIDQDGVALAFRWVNPDAWLTADDLDPETPDEGEQEGQPAEQDGPCEVQSVPPCCATHPSGWVCLLPAHPGEPHLDREDFTKLPVRWEGSGEEAGDPWWPDGVPDMVALVANSIQSDLQGSSPGYDCDAGPCGVGHPDRAIACERLAGHDDEHAAYDVVLGDGEEVVETVRWSVPGEYGEMPDPFRVAQPDGEPDPSEWGPPSEPRASEVKPAKKPATPLRAFQKAFMEKWGSFALDRDNPLTPHAADALRYRLMGIVYDGAQTMSSRPGQKKPVDPRWYDGTLGSDAPWSLDWIRAQSQEQFNAAAAAALGLP
jgi:hypothetical protein